MSNTSTIILAGNTISITKDLTGSNVADLLDKNNVTAVTGVYEEKPHNGEIGHGPITLAPITFNTFAIGETITGAMSGATAVIIGFRSADIFILSDIDGTFTSGELLTGGTSGATANATGSETLMDYPGAWIYRFPTMTVLTITMNDGKSMSIELQQVSNHNTWNTGTLTALQTAIAAINTFL